MDGGNKGKRTQGHKDSLSKLFRVTKTGVLTLRIVENRDINRQDVC